MIRSELIQKIADENPHLYQRDVERIVNTVFEEVTGAMARGDRVELRGFGAFSVKSAFIVFRSAGPAAACRS